VTVLVTERLRLRSARPGDLAAFHAILSDVEATRYWSTPPHRDLEQTRIWLDSMMSIPADEGVDFVVELAGEAIGKAGFYRWPEVGFILAPKAWGRGLAREASGLAVSIGPSPTSIRATRGVWRCWNVSASSARAIASARSGWRTAGPTAWIWRCRGRTGLNARALETRREFRHKPALTRRPCGRPCHFMACPPGQALTRD